MVLFAVVEIRPRADRPGNLHDARPGDVDLCVEICAVGDGDGRPARAAGGRAVDHAEAIQRLAADGAGQNHESCETKPVHE